MLGVLLSGIDPVKMICSYRDEAMVDGVSSSG